MYEVHIGARLLARRLLKQPLSLIPLEPIKVIILHLQPGYYGRAVVEEAKPGLPPFVANASVLAPPESSSLPHGDVALGA
jgi:hypothetical protein